MANFQIEKRTQKKLHPCKHLEESYEVTSGTKKITTFKGDTWESPTLGSGQKAKLRLILDAVIEE